MPVAAMIGACPDCGGPVCLECAPPCGCCWSCEQAEDPVRGCVECGVTYCSDCSPGGDECKECLQPMCRECMRASDYDRRRRGACTKCAFPVPLEEPEPSPPLPRYKKPSGAQYRKWRRERAQRALRLTAAPPEAG